MTMKKYLRNDLLRNAREERGWTQQQLADEMKVGVTTVRSWERGVSPHLPVRSRLCEIFGMTAEQLGLVPNGASHLHEKKPKQSPRRENKILTESVCSSE